MILIDTHAHLDDEKFAADLPGVLERARAADVVQVIAVATTASSTLQCAELAKQYPFLRSTAGIHPNHAAQAQPSDWRDVVALAARPEVVGLGETGLDRHWDYTPFAVQEDYFARHLALARKLRKPVIIHCREAEQDVIRMLREDFERDGPVAGVMHSFAADLETAEACLGMGLYISFAGMLTYKNAQALREVASRMPLDRLLVETDCPYLAPVPMRGKRNEPAFVRNTAECLAQLKGVSLEEIARITSFNARTLFAFT